MIALIPIQSLSFLKTGLMMGLSGNDGSGVYFSIEKQFSDKVKQFAEKNNINPYRVFLAAYAIFIIQVKQPGKDLNRTSTDQQDKAGK